jgi:hypothetical protein
MQKKEYMCGCFATCQSVCPQTVSSSKLSLLIWKVGVGYSTASQGMTRLEDYMFFLQQNRRLRGQNRFCLSGGKGGGGPNNAYTCKEM